MPRRLSPVDRLFLVFLAAIGLLVAWFHASVPHAGALLAAHALGSLLILVFACIPGIPGAFVFRHWYPVPYIAFCYFETDFIIPGIHAGVLDAKFASWDAAFWGVQPAVWFERIHSPALTELLQIAYALFAPSILLIAFIYWFSKRVADFRYYAFLASLGFLVSYAGYYLVPVEGPRFFMPGTSPLTGLWLFAPLRFVVDSASSHYDCFPSGHIELTILAWWSSRQISPVLSAAYAVFLLCMVVATVYLRYHYTIDLFAGILTAAAVLIVVPRIYGNTHHGPPRNHARL